MAQLSEHPTVKQFRAREATESATARPQAVGGEWLRQVCLEAGADDAGFVEIDRPEIADQKSDLLWLLPGTKTLVSFVMRMNRENIRTPARSIANLEFHHTTDDTNEAARKIVAALERIGVRAINGGAAGFPMEADRWGAKMWVVSHKPIAVAAGLGRMGIHRNVIHPKFGNFILLGTVLMDAKLSEYSHAIDYNPCLECKLCVAACPTGAIGSDGNFNFSACYTHNYREFMGGFNDWVETIADSKNRLDYREEFRGRIRFHVAEPFVWRKLQSGILPVSLPRRRGSDCAVSHGPQGIPEQRGEAAARQNGDRLCCSRFRRRGLRSAPLSSQDDEASLDGLAGQGTIRAFLRGLNLVFQRGKSEGLNATYHFTFTGQEEVKATVVICDQKLEVSDGHLGTPDFRLTSDSQTWLRFLRKEANLVWALLSRKIRIHGSPRLLLAFARCFPS